MASWRKEQKGVSITFYICIYISQFDCGLSLICFSFPEINEFTASALTMCILSLIGFVLVHLYFEDAPIKPIKKKKTISNRQQAYDSFANSPFCFGTTTLYSFALLSCMFMNAFTKGPMSCFETLGVAFAENRYGLERGTAGMIVATCGFLGCIILFMVKLTFNKHDDSKTTIFGILIFALGIALNLNLDREDALNNPTWMYAFTMFLAYSVGYPICHTALVGLFSKSKFRLCDVFISKNHKFLT
jgi:ceroid-lipofuscinosis MFS transporter 7